MNKKAIITENAPKAIGPYSQAISAGNLLFISGQIPVDPQTGSIIAGGIQDQTRQVLKNLMAILEKAGLSSNNVVKTTVYLTDLKEFEAMNKVYAEFFKKDPPARATVQVSELPKGVKIEIDAIAVQF